ncbi:hypothetical protein KML24003_08420 [Alistipes finegoldii]|jgi:hypothetical protein
MDKRSGSGLSAQIRGPVPENTATAYARTSHTEKSEDTRRTGKYSGMLSPAAAGRQKALPEGRVWE